MRRENLSGKKVYNDIKRRFVRNIIVIFLLSDLKILGTVKAIFFLQKGGSHFGTYQENLKMQGTYM